MPEGCQQSLDWTTGLDYWTGLLDWSVLPQDSYLWCENPCTFYPRVMSPGGSPPPPGLHDDYLTGLERATNRWLYSVGGFIFLGEHIEPCFCTFKFIPCTLHAPSPMLSQSPAYAQPMSSLCSANVQPTLSQCSAYALLPKMPNQCLANASASPANALQANTQPMPKGASQLKQILDRIFLASIEILWSN